MIRCCTRHDTPCAARSRRTGLRHPHQQARIRGTDLGLLSCRSFFSAFSHSASFSRASFWRGLILTASRKSALAATKNIQPGKILLILLSRFLGYTVSKLAKGKIRCPAAKVSLDV